MNTNTKEITSLGELEKGSRLLNESGSDEVLVVAINLGDAAVITESESHGETAIWSLRELQEHGILLLIGKELLNRDEAESSMREGKVVVNLETGTKYSFDKNGIRARSRTRLTAYTYEYFGLPQGSYKIVEAE